MPLHGCSGAPCWRSTAKAGNSLAASFGTSSHCTKTIGCALLLRTPPSIAHFGRCPPSCPSCPCALAPPLFPPGRPFLSCFSVNMSLTLSSARAEGLGRHRHVGQGGGHLPIRAPLSANIRRKKRPASRTQNSVDKSRLTCQVISPLQTLNARLKHPELSKKTLGSTQKIGNTYNTTMLPCHWAVEEAHVAAFTYRRPSVQKFPQCGRCPTPHDDALATNDPIAWKGVQQSAHCL
jgi:hypothetical protein